MVCARFDRAREKRFELGDVAQGDDRGSANVVSEHDFSDEVFSSDVPLVFVLGRDADEIGLHVVLAGAELSDGGD